MCTPFTMAWHIRWRVRDWTSCLTPCRFPLGDHELASSSPSSPQVPVRKDNRVKPIQNKNLSLQSKKCNNKRHLNNQMGKEKKEGVIVGDRVVDDSIRPLSAEEDYIVFSFREDGAFDVVEDCKGGVTKSEAHRGVVDGIKHKNSRPVNRKLDYGEGAEQVGDHHHIEEKRSDANQRDTDHHDQDYISLSKEDEEKEAKYLSRTQHRDNLRRTCQTEEIEDSGVVSAESRDSSQSEGSRGSFAFPVLGLEWIGSPVQMPQSEDLHLKKHKVRCVRFQCCRF